MTSLRIGTTLASIAIGASFACGGALAADIEKGHAKAKEVCAACHMENGNSQSPDFPRLAGQHADYLEKALRDYKSGTRKNPIMAAVVMALSKQDMENLAAYYSAQPPAVVFK